MAGLLIYKSSAGSGKTFNLVKTYLKLVLENPDKYRNILAITFTNKATREMKVRIVDSLRKIAAGEETTMAQVLLQEFKEQGIKMPSIQQRAQAVLQNVLHDYTRFSVSTIDSFFSGIIRSFARELGLSGNYDLQLDQNEILEEIIDWLMLDIGKDPTLRKWLLNFTYFKMESGKSWNIQQEIAGLGQQLFDEQFQKLQQSYPLQDKDQLKTDLDAFLKELNQIIADFTASAHAMIDRIFDHLMEYSLKPEDFSGGQRSPLMNLVRLKEKEDKAYYWANFLDKIQKKPTEKLAAQSSPKKEAIKDCAENGLWDLVEESANLYQNKIQAYRSANLVKETVYAFGIIMDLSLKLRDYRAEHEILTPSDINNLLNQVTAETDSPFIYEKIGTMYQHYLVDEFQDTSDFQWQNLRPLVQNSLSNQFTSMLVGDAKQSIYRWRGGNPLLLLEQVNHDFSAFQDLLKEIPLQTNFRSLDNIIKFNNRLFGLATTYLNDGLNSEEASLLQEAYAQPEQDPLEGKFGGYVDVRFYEGQKKEAWETAILKALVEDIHQLLQQGYQYRDIALLVRTNGQASAIVNHLTHPDINLPVLSAESLLLGNATIPRFLVNLLRYLNDPTDDLLKAEILNDYLRYIAPINDEGTPHQLYAMKDDSSNALERLMPDAFIGNVIYLRKLPLYELAEELIDIFGLNEHANTYLQRFQDLILEYSENEQVDIPNFLEWWEEAGHKKAVTIPPGENAIRIETIHKSKGLQFPVVFVPFIKWKLDAEGGSNSDLVWVHSNDPPFNKFPYLPVKMKKELAESYFAEAYAREQSLSRLENLNLMYVAFTRAVERLYVKTPDPNTSKGDVNTKNVNGLLYQLLETATFQQNWDAENMIYAYGNPDFAPQSSEAGSQIRKLESFPHSRWRQKLTIRPRARQLIQGMEDEVFEKVDYGNLMHGILERIRHPEDLDEAIEAMKREGLLRAYQEQEIRNAIREVLELPQVKDWFVDQWDIKTEKDILLPDGSVFRPDRVLIHENKAVVIDYKTGQPEKAHQSQVQKYAKILQQMGYSEVEGYLLYLEEPGVEKVDLN